MNIVDLRVRGQKIGVISMFSRFCLLALVSLFGATSAHAVGAIAVGEYMTNDGKFAVWGIAVEAPTGAEARARATSRCNASLEEGRYTGTDSTRGPLDSSYSVTIPCGVDNSSREYNSDEGPVYRNKCLGLARGTASREASFFRFSLTDRGTGLLAEFQARLACTFASGGGDCDALLTNAQTRVGSITGGGDNSACDNFTPSSCPGESTLTGNRCQCPNGKELDFSDNTCACASTDIEIGGDCVTRMTCTGGKELDEANNTCNCPSGQIAVAGICELRMTCTNGKELDESDNTCSCPSAEIELANGNCAVPMTCASGEELDRSDNTCDCLSTHIRITDGTCVTPMTCASGEELDRSDNTCDCLSTHIRITDGTCVTPATCPSEATLNTADNTCQCPGVREHRDNACSCPSTHLEISGNCVTRENCTGGKVLNEANNTCSCPSEQIDVSGTCMTPATCPSEATLNTADNMCQCPGGKELNEANNTCSCPSAQIEIAGNCVTPLTCTGGKELDTSNNTCSCPSTKSLEVAGNCVTPLTCPDDKELNTANNTCVCSSTDIEINGTCETRMTCTNGKELNTSDNTCACPSTDLEIAGTCVTRATCPSDATLDTSDNTCQCPDGKEVITVEATPICGIPLPVLPEESTYTKETCESQGWSSREVLDTANNIAELCSISFIIIASPPEAGTRTSESETETPLRLEPGDESDDCIIRNNPDYEGDFARCDDVFGAEGEFPLASAYSSDAPLHVIIGANSIVSQPQPQPSSGGGGGGGGGSVGAIIGVIGGVGLLTWLFLDGDPLALNFTPHAEMRHNNGVNYYAYGSKVDYSKDNWTGYWQAAQIRSGDRVGDWIYGTGTSWTNHIFSASMMNTTGGTNSDTAFSLSARKVLNTWTLESSYIADWSVSELTDTTWRNRLSLGGSVVYEQWTITPKAELSWQSEDNIGDNARLRFDLSRDL